MTSRGESPAQDALDDHNELAEFTTVYRNRYGLMITLEIAVLCGMHQSHRISHAQVLQTAAESGMATSLPPPTLHDTLDRHLQHVSAAPETAQEAEQLWR